MTRGEKLVQWLRKNASWVFGGIGVYAVGGVIATIGFFFRSSLLDHLDALWSHLTSQGRIAYWLVYVLATLSSLQVVSLLRRAYHRYERVQVRPILQEQASEYNKTDAGMVCEPTSATKALRLLDRITGGSPVAVLIQAWECSQAVDLWNGRGNEEPYILNALGILGQRARGAVRKIEAELKTISPLKDRQRWDHYLDCLTKIGTSKARTIFIEAKQRKT